MAKALLSCIETSRQRYGATVIIDTVHGANTAKIRGYGMNENPEYGSLAKVPVYRLRQVLNQLQLEGYLTATNDEYAILRLTPKAASVLNNEETVWMKLAKEQTKSEQETQKKSRKKKHSENLPKKMPITSPYCWNGHTTLPPVSAVLRKHIACHSSPQTGMC